MASPLQEAAVQAVELENFAKGIPDLVYKGRTFYNLIKKKSKTFPTSVTTQAGGTSRPSFRIPVRIQSGAAIFQATGNGDALGRGTGSNSGGRGNFPHRPLSSPQDDLTSNNAPHCC